MGLTLKRGRLTSKTRVTSNPAQSLVRSDSSLAVGGEEAFLESVMKPLLLSFLQKR